MYITSFFFFNLSCCTAILFKFLSRKLFVYLSLTCVLQIVFHNRINVYYSESLTCVCIYITMIWHYLSYGTMNKSDLLVLYTKIYSPITSRYIYNIYVGIFSNEEGEERQDPFSFSARLRATECDKSRLKYIFVQLKLNGSGFERLRPKVRRSAVSGSPHKTYKYVYIYIMIQKIKFLVDLIDVKSLSHHAFLFNSNVYVNSRNVVLLGNYTRI